MLSPCLTLDIELGKSTLQIFLAFEADKVYHSTMLLLK
jgi:hypothetical protein